jgi:hypothetical protein
MTYRRPTRPTREDVAAEKVTRECAARGHSYPEPQTLRPTQTQVGPRGQITHRQQTPCRECGTLRVQTWNQPEATSGTTTILAIGTYQAPEPGDIPHLADHAARLTDEEFAAALAAAGYGDPPPAPAAQVSRDITRPQTFDLTVHVRAEQFYLLDDDATPGSIIPLPDDATSAGIIDTVPSAAVLWTGLHQGQVNLTVVVSPADPGADLHGYEDVVELTYRSTTGHIMIKELGGGTHPLAPLPNGYGDHRLRYHIRGADTAHRTETSDDPIGHHLLQIWRAPRTRPTIVKATSQWASVHARIVAPAAGPGTHPGLPTSRRFLDGLA